MEYTLNYVKSANGHYSGHLMELPGVITQAETLDELKINIKDALGAMLEVLREETETEPVLLCWEKSEKVKIEL